MITPSVDIHILSHENACGATLSIDTTTINSNVHTIICSTSNKTSVPPRIHT